MFSQVKNRNENEMWHNTIYIHINMQKSIFHSDTYKNIHKSQKNRKPKEFRRIRNEMWGGIQSLIQ